ncbi:MAG: TolB family protein, partial [Thermoanaerobaculia bacterium]
RLDSLGDRLMMPGVYRAFNDHESLLVNHSVQSSNATAAVRWYEIRKATGSPQLFQQGTFSPDALSRWMGSVAMDAGGNVLAGYAVAGSATKTGIRVAGRTPGDPVGVLSSELTVASGTKSQTGAGRWGDYSHMSVDPVDDCTFWYTTELMNGPNSGTFEWSTKIAAFRFAGCTAGGGGGGGGGAGGTAARIVFVSSRDGNREIYSMDSDGSNVTRLTSNPAADYSPAPSADGKRILFVSERDGRPQIYSMNTDGTDQRRLAASNAADEQPAALPKTMSAISMEMPDSATRELEMAPVPVATTVWGGDGAALRVSPRGLEIEFACANATLDSPLPASGAFDIPATYYEQRPGPVRSDLPQGPPQSARVVGRVDANRIEFRVVLPNGRVVAENQLERGRAARVVKCVSP